jgi:hypothetical protein
VHFILVQYCFIYSVKCTTKPTIVHFSLKFVETFITVCYVVQKYVTDKRICVVLIMYRWCLVILLFLLLLLFFFFVLVVVVYIFVVDTAIIVNIYVIISPRLGLERLEYIQREQTKFLFPFINLPFQRRHCIHYSFSHFTSDLLGILLLSVTFPLSFSVFCVLMLTL